MNNTALITGASSGIGRQLAQIHASKGGDLVLIARSAEKLREIKESIEKQYGVKVYLIFKDLSAEGAAKEVFEELAERKIDVDIIMNNAGFGDYAPFVSADEDKLTKMIDLNVRTLTSFMKLFLPQMVERKRGKILNIASIAAFQPGPLMAVYFATKAYVLYLSEAVSDELKGTGVSVTALCPGPTDTGFVAAADWGGSVMIKGKKLPGPARVAALGYRAMEKGRPFVIDGFKNRLMIFAERFLPRRSVVKLVHILQRAK